MDRSVGSPWTRSVVGSADRGSVFSGYPIWFTSDQVNLSAGLKHRSQVTGQVRSQVRSQVTGQVTRKNIFLPRKLTIFNSKLTRYEKESVIMRGIVYFKLQDVALRD